MKATLVLIGDNIFKFCHYSARNSALYQTSLAIRPS